MFGAFAQLWRCLLRRFNASLTFSRLQALLRMLQGLLEVGFGHAMPCHPCQETGERKRGRPLTGTAAAKLFEALLKVLEQTEHPRLLAEVVPTLALAAKRAPGDFGAFFQAFSTAFQAVESWPGCRGLAVGLGRQHWHLG